MSSTNRRVRARLLMIAGLALVAYPLGDQVAARQGQLAPAAQGGGAAVINGGDLPPALQGFRWRSIGPTGQGGRIDDVEAVETNPSTFYIGFAVSGLWKTTNNGITFENLFAERAQSIGDIGIAPSNPDIVYVGTGEPNNRQSSSFGEGVYKTTDAGATWTHVGLRDTQSIARVVVHPRDPNTVWVAAIGHLFGPNDDRGVYMTTDGGATWTKTLHINQDTGATDIIVNRANPNQLFAATYERRRQSWAFVGGGPGSGLHQSTDGGRTWRRVTGNGLPRGTMGRIGLDWSRSNQDVIYAQIEVAADKEPAPAPGAEPAGQAGRAGGGGGGFGGGGGGRGGGAQTPDPTLSGVWRSTDRGRTWTFMSNENQRPMYYSQIRVDPTNHDVVYVGGVSPRKSTDGGRTFETMTGQGHVDNHAIWINPNNAQHVMYGNDGGLDISYDGGENWESVRLWAVGLPYHVSVDLSRPYNVCTGLQDNGSWCGPSHTRSNGIRQWHWISVGGGDGFQTQVDPTDPNIFYTESQNGGINRYDLSTGQTFSARPQPGGGGRGGGGGGGGRGGGRGNIIGDVRDGELHQFNWNTPIRISHHNPHTVITGGRQLFISRNRGETFTRSISLGKGIDPESRVLLEQPYNLPSCGRGAGPGQPCILSKNDGLVNNEFGTIIEIGESPITPGVIWVGTNDGNIQLTRDDGRTWTEVGANIPGGTKEYHVSGVEASWFDEGTAYVSLDGHLANDLAPYVYKTTDYGRTWASVAGDLPRGNVNSIRQDPVNPNLLYAPAEFGFYISLNDGRNWHKFMPGLPNSRIDEVVVHPRENDLILASHGYSIWIMDDIAPLQALTEEAMNAPATLFQTRDAVMWRTDRRLSTEVPGNKWWQGENAPRGSAISYYLSRPASNVVVRITNTATGEDVRTCQGTGHAGMNRYQWTLSGNPGAGGGGGGRGGRGGAQAEPQAPPADPATQPCDTGGGGGGRGFGGGGGRGGGGGGIGPGVYRVTLTVDGRDAGTHTFNVLDDVWMK